MDKLASSNKFNSQSSKDDKSEKENEQEAIVSYEENSKNQKEIDSKGGNSCFVYNSDANSELQAYHEVFFDSELQNFVVEKNWKR